jgi:hypothetical protein
MRSQNHDSRLASRESQTRHFSAPLPDFSSLPRPSEAARMRAEWDTRDTMNNRMWTHTQVSGATAVTATMLSQHPTNGAEPFAPLSARQDARTYDQGQYFPNANKATERPTLPPSSLFQNAWMEGYHTEDGNTARELRGAVKEDVRWRGEDTSARLAGRTFEHQWIPASATKQIVNAQISAADILRPQADNYHLSYRN